MVFLFYQVLSFNYFLNNQQANKLYFNGFINIQLNPFVLKYLKQTESLLHS